MKNQCDGCLAGQPIGNGLHYDLETGKVLMVCQKDRYENTFPQSDEDESKKSDVLDGPARTGNADVLADRIPH